MKELERFTVSGNEDSLTVPVRLLIPGFQSPSHASPLIIVHDGSEYDSRCQISERVNTIAEHLHAAPILALLDADTHENNFRLRNYGASEAYRCLLRDTIIPTIREKTSSQGPVIGIGASMGALALLHSAESFDGLFLQSASIHHPDYTDNADYDEFDTVSRFVEGAREQLPVSHKISITMTCGDEPNLRGNQDIFYALRRQGHNIEGGRVEGGHDYESWSKALDPHLQDLLLSIDSLYHRLPVAS